MLVLNRELSYFT